MKAPVYRSLDKPSAFFGIRGRFITWLLLLAGAAALVGFFVGIATARWLGWLTAAIGAVVAYFYIIGIQGKSSDRTFAIKMNSRRYVRYIRTQTGPMRSMLKYEDDGTEYQQK